MPIAFLLIGESALGAFIAAFFGILAARAYRGGIIARAMTWIVAGQVIMSLGNVMAALELAYGKEFIRAFVDPAAAHTFFRMTVAFSLIASVIGFVKLWSVTRVKT